MKFQSKRLLAFVLTVASTQVFAIGQKWPVEDTVTHQGLADIHIAIQQNNENAKMTAVAGERGAVTQSLNNASIAITQDLKHAELNAAPSLQKCINVTRARGSGAAIAGQTNAATALSQQLAVPQNSFGEKNFQSVTDMSGTRAETCTVADVNNGLPGCKKPGAMAGWTEQYAALTKNPLDNNKSLSSDQVANAMQFITNSLYSLAPDPAAGGKEGSTSTKNAALRKIWHTRVSPSVYAVQQQLGEMRQLDLPANHPLMMAWNEPSMKDAYTQLRSGNSVRPEKPSPVELQELQILKNLYYSGDIAKAESTARDIDVLRLLERQMAMSNYLQYQQITQLKIMNAQLQAINANLLAPVSNDNNQGKASGK